MYKQPFIRIRMDFPEFGAFDSLDIADHDSTRLSLQNEYNMTEREFLNGKKPEGAPEPTLQ